VFAVIIIIVIVVAAPTHSSRSNFKLQLVEWNALANTLSTVYSFFLARSASYSSPFDVSVSTLIFVFY